MIRNFKRHINFQRTQKMFIITHEFKKVIYEHSSFFFFFFFFFFFILIEKKERHY